VIVRTNWPLSRDGALLDLLGRLPIFERGDDKRFVHEVSYGFQTIQVLEIVLLLDAVYLVAPYNLAGIAIGMTGRC
jgi:hypothetical protein